MRSLLRDAVWIWLIFAATWQTIDLIDWVRRWLRWRVARRILNDLRRQAP